MRRRPSERHRLFAALYFLQRIWEPLGVARHRRAVARGVRGRTLEIGTGTGYSLPHYSEGADLIACDPSIWMVGRARKRARDLGIPVCFVVAAGEALPFRNEAFETVVSQIVFCTVDDPATVASEVGRVLAPDGTFRFVEHGLADRPGYRRAQRAIAPVWRKLFGGCRLDRDVVAPMIDAGLTVVKLKRCNGGAVVRGSLRSAVHESSVPGRAAS
ncbi:MAG: class I SAM-dependent methyltransferase [Actinomycetota bacterium]